MPTHTTRRRAALILAPLFIFAVAACGEEEPAEEVPETVTVDEIDPDEEVGERIEWDDETVLTEGDVGRAILATGTVLSTGSAGFLLATEVPRVIFVQSDDDVSTGDVVEVVGTLAELEIVTLDELEVEMFGDAGFEVEWEVDEAFYIANANVDPAGT